MTPRVVLLALGVLAARVAAQEPARAPLLVARADTVFLYVTDPPATAAGFLVYRSQAGAEPVRVTPQPVVAARGSAEAVGLIGADLPMVKAALRAQDDAQAWRRLRTDRFAAGVLTLVSRGVARALGRFVADAGLTPGATYDYRLVWTDADGREQGAGVRARVVVRDEVPPPPLADRARPGDNEVEVAWTYPSGGDAVLGFHVYRAEDASGAPRRLTGEPVLRGTPGRATYRDRDARNGVTYRYRVTAVDVLGRESAPSAIMIARPVDRTPPAPPTGLATQAGEGTVHLVWRLSPEPDVASYRVLRATSLTGTFERIGAAVPALTPEWSDSGVAAGHMLFYRVVAVDSAGNASEPSNPISAMPTDRTPPPPPASVSGSLRGRLLVVRWAASPERGVLGYHVYRGEAADRMTRLTAAPLPAGELVDSGFGGAGLVPGRTYLVQVTALDSSRNESKPVTATVHVPDDDPPGPPAGFRARPVDGRTIELTWSPSSAPDVRGYVLTREGAPGVEVARLGAAGRTARDTGLVEGRTYAYRLVAVDSAGNVSAAVRDALLLSDRQPPAAPRAVVARVVAGGVAVSWERVASRDLVGYVVERADLPTGVFVRLTPAPVAALQFTDPDGRAGRFYRVRAVDAGRNESAPSPIAGVVP